MLPINITCEIMNSANMEFLVPVYYMLWCKKFSGWILLVFLGTKYAYAFSTFLNIRNQFISQENNFLGSNL